MLADFTISFSDIKQAYVYIIIYVTLKKAID